MDILGIGAVMLIAPICIGITLYYSVKYSERDNND
jgi:hypothetical protein|tara:strand:+ start:298 stop:402 length:105 start_codon:yes stop_codon:yes gene_type:complete